MKYVYDVESEVYKKDRNERTGNWENESVTVVANGTIQSAIRVATKALMNRRSQPYRLTDPSEDGRWVDYRTKKVNITSIKRVREIE